MVSRCARESKPDVCQLNNCDLWSLGPPPPRAGGPVPLGTRELELARSKLFLPEWPGWRAARHYFWRQRNGKLYARWLSCCGLTQPVVKYKKWAPAYVGMENAQLYPPWPTHDNKPLLRSR